MNLTELLNKGAIILDGGMGTLLAERGLLPGELPERLCLSAPDIITEIHRAYFNAGSNIVCTNTFGANLLKYSHDELREVIFAAVKCARDAAEDAKDRFVALDVGPLGRMLKPYGDLDFEDAVGIFAETVKIGASAGVDLVVIETMNDSYETKAALLAAKESCDLPVFVTNAYGEDGKLVTGASPLAMIAMLEGMGADAVGVNCSLGPRALRPVIDEYLRYASVPVIFKPNAGLPREISGRTVFDVLPTEFAEEILAAVESGVSIVGGCCGTTPEYIGALKKRLSGFIPPMRVEKNDTVASSYTHGVLFGESSVLVGERINPTGKRRFKEALISRDIGYILNEGLEEERCGAHILDVNVGLPEIDETAMLTRTVTELQAIISLPLEIDTSSPEAMEAALRIYNGKAVINSVSGKKESMDAIFPLAKKYGGVIIALTLDESGIPETAEGRVAIAERILAEAEKHGIKKKDIVFDPLALTVSADKNAARETLRALSIIKNKLGAHTSLGVSNISFGLPMRPILNSTFFAMALASGLSAAIINPYSDEMMRVYHSYRALMGLDESFADYLAYAESVSGENNAASNTGAGISTKKTLGHAIEKGLRREAEEICRELIREKDGLSIIKDEVIPALDAVGVGFEEKRIYLPTLLMSAEAARAAFDVIAESMPKDASAERLTVVIATVKGDIHDIGKNIVKLLLENYGFKVIDLGKDVSPEVIAKEAVDSGADIVALSALMTTTVPAMRETIELLRKDAPAVKVVVGGAVLTRDYADSIGADKYAKDAMAAVRYAEEVEKELKSK